MEGKQFSTSRGHSIYLRDFLDRYDPDPLRYYLIAASPETQDTDFTWADFVRRNNDELLANWGNLVNRTLTNAHRNFGAVPEPGALTPEDQARARRASTRGFASVGAHLEAGRFRAALGEAMRLASIVNQYISDQAPWALVKTDRARAGNRAVRLAARRRQPEDDLHAVPAAHLAAACTSCSATTGCIAGPVEFREVEDDGETHEILTGDYTGWVGSWEPSDLQPGQPLREPKPLFRKLDESIVDEELQRMRDAGAE